MDALLLLPDTEVEGDEAFEALVAVNHRWLGHYARLHPSFSVEPTLLERNSLWMNAYFQKNRMITPTASLQAKNLIKKHRDTVVERLRSAPLPHSESPFSTSIVDPMAALMFAASIDRCPHNNLEDLLAEAWELLQCASIRAHALRSGFAGCIFRFLTEFTEPQKRIPCLRLLVLLAEENGSAVVNSCKVAAQGQFWKPNMFVFSLQKRHQDNSTLCELAARLLECFSEEMPIPPPIVLDQSYEEDRQLYAGLAEEISPLQIATSPLRGGTALPLLTGNHRAQSPYRPPFSPTTTISRLYQEAPSPYCPTMKLPLTRPPTSPVEQCRRSKIFSMPRLAAVEGQRQYRCNTPNGPQSRVERSIDVEATRTLDPLFGSPLQSPSATSPSKLRAAVSEKYSWNPECINSVSGFEWWWRSLPQNHASLEPTQKLKMVTKAAVRLHSKGELQRAIELYLLALSSEANDEVSFRLRINLACAYEAAEDLLSSIDEFRLALELNPHDLYANYKLGCVLTMVGEFDEARMHFESILNEYPQAAEGLANLEKAIEAHTREEEARKAAVAAAKERRSPLKVVSPRYMTPREPIAPSAPLVQPPAPHRNKFSTAKRVPSIEPRGKRENEQPSIAITPEILLKPETATVGTLTDDHLSSSSLLELLVRRCQEARINMLDVLHQLDPQQRGLVHRESFINFVRIVTGVCALDDDARMALYISPSDWVSSENQVFLKYSGFVEAYREQHQVEAALLSSGEAVRIKLLVDELVRHDMAHFSHHCVSGWMHEGSVRAAAKLHKHLSSAGLTPNRSKAAEETDAHKHTNGTDRTCSAPDLFDGGDIITPRTRVRKDRAREEWLLTAEKARVLARRQQHCMKSLRDIAVRAKAHIISRRKAMAFMLVVAQNAQEELRARKLRCMTARQDERTHHKGESGYLVVPPLVLLTFSDSREEVQPSAVKVLSEETYDFSLQAAMTRLRQNADHEGVKGLSEEVYDATVRMAVARIRQNAELEDVKAVAARFAEFCQVPSYLS